MQDLTQPKWFIYIHDHNEGPMPAATLFERLERGELGENPFVWAAEMPNWVAFKDVTELRDGYAYFQSTRVEPTPSMPTEPSFEMKVDSLPDESEPSITVIPSSPSTQLPIEMRTHDEEIAAAPQKKSKRRRWWVAAVPALLLILGGIGLRLYLGNSPGTQGTAGVPTGDFWTQFKNQAQPMLLNFGARFPGVWKLFSPLPSVQDLTPEDYQRLVAVASRKLDQSGPQLAIAASTEDTFRPRFYAALNLPAAVKLDGVIIGRGDTLVGLLEFSQPFHLQASDQGLALGAAIELPEGRPLAKGEYEIWVVDSSEQDPAVAAQMAQLPVSPQAVPSPLPPGRHFVGKLVVFLGGARDQNYSMRLKAFHDKLVERATAEVNELRQFQATLASQFEILERSFEDARKGLKPNLNGKVAIPKPRKKAWDKSFQAWTQLQEQLTQTFSKWTPEVLSKEYFHSNLYEKLTNAGARVARTQELNQAFFTERPDVLNASTFESMKSTARAEAVEALFQLKQLLERAEKIGLTPNGAPQKVE